jgi:hypothetical protein
LVQASHAERRVHAQRREHVPLKGHRKGAGRLAPEGGQHRGKPRREGGGGGNVCVCVFF